MMKRILVGIMTVASMFATSCVKSLENGNAGQEATVSFAVSTPEIATRAYSDGTTATELQYAVYDAAGNHLPKLNGETEINISTTVELQLTTGNEYYVIFWAAAPSAPYAVDFTTKTMTVDYTAAKSNDEVRDAFYAYHKITVKGAQTETVKLYRPFAQLNIGTSDYAASADAGYTPTQSSVKVKSIYNTLNLATGEVSGYAEVAFGLNNIPTEETFPVAGNEYVAMNYLLVDADKELVDIEFTYTDGSNAKTRTVGSVPVQRNYRTNIYGQLLTSDVDINVTIVPDFNEPAHEADPLQIAASCGGKVVLEEDVVLTNPLVITAGVEIDLNGHSITGDFADKDAGTVIHNKGSLKLIGGTVQNTSVNGASAIQNDGSLIIDGTKVIGSSIADGSYPAYAIYTSGSLVVEEGSVIESDRGAINMSNGADVTINGGDIYVTDALNGRVLTAHVIYAYGKNSKLTINDGKFALNYAAAGNTGASVICPTGATISVYGGEFTYAGTVGQSGIFQNYMGYGVPVNVYGGSYNDTTVGKNLAAGYKTVESSNGLYYVVENTVENIAATADDLVAALEDGKDVTLVSSVKIDPAGMSNAYGTTGINIKNGETIDGNGFTLDIKGAGGTWDSGINTTGGLIKNITVTGSFRGIFINHTSAYSEPVVLENVTIEGTTYTISCDQGMNQTLKATNSTFKGWTSYAATLGSASFTGCYFGYGNGYAYCRPYAPTAFVDCDFEKGFQMDPRAQVTFENCRLDGVKLTSENIATLVTSNVANVVSVK